MKGDKKVFTQPRLVFKGATYLGALGLLIAYVAEHIFNLSPCILCVYERIPYAISLLIGLLGWTKPKAFPQSLLVILLISFLGGAGLSFYHSGIEHGFFSSFTACGGNPHALDVDTIEELKELILESPVVRCDQVYFRFLGLSLTEYNLLLSLLISGSLGYRLWSLPKSPPKHPLKKISK